MSSLAALTNNQCQTRAFLTLLEARVRAQPFDFRTFDDQKGRALRSLVGKLTGTIDETEARLQRRNASGAGVFVVINKGGQTDAEITRVRAVFADTDGAPLEPIVEALAPHAVIYSSPGKWHVYWLVDEDFPLDQFTPIQKAIARKFGTDPSVHNRSRVMRLPGFAHSKGTPFDVHFVEPLNHTLPRYSIDEIVEGLGLDEAGQSGAKPAANVAADPALHQASLADNSPPILETEEMLRFIDPWFDRDDWIKVLLAIANVHGEAGRELVVRWSRGDLWPRSHMLGTNL
jgi:hypothetical protein